MEKERWKKRGAFWKSERERERGRGGGEEGKMGREGLQGGEREREEGSEVQPVIVISGEMIKICKKGQERLSKGGRLSPSFISTDQPSRGSAYKKTK